MGWYAGAVQRPTIDDFRTEYDSESLVHFRARYLTLLAVAAAIAIAIGVIQAVYFNHPGLPAPSRDVKLVGIAAAFAGAIALLVRLAVAVRARQPMSRAVLLKRVKRLIIMFTLLQAAAAPALAKLIVFAGAAWGWKGNIGIGVPPVLGTLLIHFIAAMLIPWSPREAIKPILPFVIIYSTASILAFITRDSDIKTVGVMLAVTIGAVLPGVGIPWIRQSLFRERFMNRTVRDRYAELSSELSTARRIHDRLFPLPITDGPVRIEFAYEPMRQIGGDILYARRTSRGTVNLVVIDVTGHGIAAALAVNRLHAELNRLYGLDPDASPSDIIAALNSYVCLTMAADRFFATALSVQLDAGAGTLRWANAGHPPLFLWNKDGTCQTLDSTVIMLGVMEGSDFEPDEQRSAWSPGDVLYAYSDGAIEASAESGRMLAVAGLRDLTSARPSAAALLASVRTFRSGPAQDDMLLVRVEHVG